MRSDSFQRVSPKWIFRVLLKVFRNHMAFGVLGYRRFKRTGFIRMSALWVASQGYVAQELFEGFQGISC